MKRVFLSLLMSTFALIMFAQPSEPKHPQGQPPFDPQKFQQMVEEELTKAASLTAEEAKALFPLYHEMRSKQRELGKQIFEVKKNTSGDARAYANAIQKVNQLKVKMAEVEQDYYKRILKVVPAEKVFKVMKAEDDFHRRMVQGRNKRRGNHARGARDGQRPRQQP